MNDLREFLGETGKDAVTGFKGVITAECSYASGFQRLEISPVMDEKGETKEERWFDYSRVEIVPPASE